jgi:hypothetical protein
MTPGARALGAVCAGLARGGVLVCSSSAEVSSKARASQALGAVCAGQVLAEIRRGVVE